MIRRSFNEQDNGRCFRQKFLSLKNCGTVIIGINVSLATFLCPNFTSNFTFAPHLEAVIISPLAGMVLMVAHRLPKPLVRVRISLPA